MISQLQVISKILNTKDLSIVTANNIDDSYFFNYKNEFNFILNHYDRYRTVPDKLSFLNTFPDFNLIDVAEPDTYLLEQLYQDYNRSYLSEKFNKIKAMLENDDDPSRAVDFFLNSVDKLHTGEVMTCTNLMQDTSRFDHYLEKTVDQGKYYYSTGFAELDALIGGIDKENENMVISARPGQGKTQVLIKVATALARQGKTVGIFEGEMTADKIGYRVDTFLGNIKNSSINRGDLFVKEAYESYINNLRNNPAGYGNIKVLTQNDVPGGVVNINTLRTFIEQEQLDVLLVDQYSLLDDISNNGRLPEHERVGNIAKAIKKLQVEKHIPIISVSQMNRTKNEDGSQDTSQISLSDKIPQYATVLIMLEQKENQENTNLPVKLDLNIVKSRDGGDHHKLSYAVNFNTGNWQFMVTDDNPQSQEARQIADAYAVDTGIEDDTCPF